MNKTIIIERWYEYNKNGNLLIYAKDSKGFESWYKYNKDSKLIHRIVVA